ncbi:MAG: capping complex subunit for YIEGIA [Peptostreptococcaceae bacterium]
MGINIGITEYSLAVLTTDKNMQIGGGCPIFYADDNKDLQKKAMLMAKCVGGMVHAISDNTLIIVKH